MKTPNTLALVVLGMALSSSALANSTGIPGRAKIGCTGSGCHTGGTAPTLTFDAPATVAPGQTIDLLVMVEDPQEAAMPKAGINLEAESGALLADADGVLKPLLGQLVHASPVPFDGEMVHFMFQWTAPDTLGPVTLYAAVNSVNGDFSAPGDMSALIEATITVAEAGAGGGGGEGGTPGGGGGTDTASPDGGVDDGGDSGGSSGGCQLEPGRAPVSGRGLAFGGLLILALRRRIRRR